jgi:hypothetical protein
VLERNSYNRHKFQAISGQAENGAAQNGPFGAVFAVAPIGLGQNGAEAELDRCGAGFSKQRPGAVRFGLKKLSKEWAEPAFQPAPACLVRPRRSQRPTPIEQSPPSSVLPMAAVHPHSR